MNESTLVTNYTAAQNVTIIYFLKNGFFEIFGFIGIVLIIFIILMIVYLIISKLICRNRNRYEDI